MTRKKTLSGKIKGFVLCLRRLELRESRLHVSCLKKKLLKIVVSEETRLPFNSFEE